VPHGTGQINAGNHFFTKTDLERGGT